MTKIGDCFIRIKNGANIKQSKDASGIPITRIETISNSVFNRDRMGYANIKDPAAFDSYILKDGDILMSHINSLQYLGRSVVYRKQGNEILIHGMNLLVLRPDQAAIDSDYAALLFGSRRFRDRIKKIAKKSVNQASFSIADLKKIDIAIPALANQREVVSKFNALDRHKLLHIDELRQLDSLVKSRFSWMGVAA